jgi:hypothetical protein
VPMRKRILLVLLLLSIVLASSCLFFGSPPEGQRGSAAEELATRLENGVNLNAWRQIKAITWVFYGKNTHIWDRTRQLAYVRYGEKEDLTEVLFETQSKRGIALRAGQRVTDAEEEKKLVQSGYSRWINDSFWLNPVATLRNPGVALGAVPDEPSSLLVRYGSGGVTPGDTYKLKLDANGRMSGWEMWVQVVPIKGSKASFEKWVQLPGGAWVSTYHKLALGIELTLDNIKTAETAAELAAEGKDPFAPLLAVYPR